MRRTVMTVVVSAALAGLASGAAQAESLRFMTGPQGGVWVPLGGALKNMWEQAQPGLSVSTSPGAGIANIRGVDEGKAEVGFGNSISTVDGLAGKPPFPKKVSKVCQLANLYPQYYQVVALADSKVETIKDLKGKTLVTQPKGNTGEAITADILKANGLAYSDLKVSFVQAYTDAVSMLKDGHAQVFTLGTTVPASSVMDLASARDVKLIGVDDAQLKAMKAINPGYNKITVKAGTYPKQDKDVDVIGYSTHVVVGCDLGEQTVYNMVKTMAAKVADMAAINKAMEGLTVKAMAQDIGVPLHPGAAKFYKEQGAL